jgi:hypothetical protein
MKPIWLGLSTSARQTHVVAMRGAQTILRAQLCPYPSSGRAVTSLLEALALSSAAKTQAVRGPSGLAQDVRVPSLVALVAIAAWNQHQSHQAHEHYLEPVEHLIVGTFHQATAWRYFHTNR